MKYKIIYKTINLINNKIYIGSTKSENKFYLGSGRLISKAIKKFGKQNFKREILFNCRNEKQTELMEKYFIKKYDSTNRDIGYNVSFGGKSFFKGLSHSIKTLRKFSFVKSGKNNPFYGRNLTEEHKRKISLSEIRTKRKSK